MTAILDAVPPKRQWPLLSQASPLRLLLNDVVLGIRNLHFLPLVFFPLNLARGGVLQDISVLGLAYQAFALLLSLILTALLAASFLAGLPPPSLALAVTLVALWPLKSFQRRQVVTLATGQRQTFGPDRDGGKGPHAREEWFFVNGICTTPYDARLALARLERLFGRRVTGITNRTLGAWFDFVETLVQRDFGYRTRDVREGYMVLKSALLRAGTRRVVLIAHSQGGVLASAWVDQLLAELDEAELRKLEVYTFASAANHFAAPSFGTADRQCREHVAEGAKDDATTATATAVVGTSNGSRVGARRPTFAHVEHFANEYDFVARIGVLAFAKPISAQPTRVPAPVPQVDGGGATSSYLPSDVADVDDADARKDDRLAPLPLPLRSSNGVALLPRSSRRNIAELKRHAADVAPAGVTPPTAARDHLAAAASDQGREEKRDAGGRAGEQVVDDEGNAAITAVATIRSNFGGRLFLRPRQSGHLLVDHYLGEDGSNILELPDVASHSRLAQYLGGRLPA